MGINPWAAESLINYVDTPGRTRRVNQNPPYDVLLILLNLISKKKLSE